MRIHLSESNCRHLFDLTRFSLYMYVRFRDARGVSRFGFLFFEKGGGRTLTLLQMAPGRVRAILDLITIQDCDWEKDWERKGWTEVNEFAKRLI